MATRSTSKNAVFCPTDTSPWNAMDRKDATENHGVGGSIPPLGTNDIPQKR
jgi:hypothetical protein